MNKYSTSRSSKRGHGIPRKVLSLLLALALAGCASTAPAPQTVAAASALMRPAQSPATPSHTFSPGDEFDLRVPDAPQFDLTSKVAPDGYVNLPSIGIVRFQGRTPQDVQSELRVRMETLAGVSSNREYLMHPNDELEVKFPFAQQLNEVVRVRPDGKLQLQLIGAVQAEGLSAEELQRSLVKQYSRYLRKPEIAVLVRSVNSQSVRTAGGSGRAGLRGLEPTLIVRSFQPQQVFIGGEVGRPGAIQYRAGLSLMQALVESGGQLPTGDPSELRILRRSANDTVEVVQAGLDADKLRSPSTDILLAPFDVVILPKSGVATLADNLNAYVFNLFPFIKNSSVGYTIDSYKFK